MQTQPYHRPRSLGEAFECISASPEARIIAGGTDLLVQRKKRRSPSPIPVVSLRSVAELSSIEVQGGGIRIGAAVPLADVAKHPFVREQLPVLLQSIEVLGSPQIRNVATLGGNLCNASPAADTAPALLVLEARVELASQEGRREVAMAEFFKGPGQTVLHNGEILSGVVVDAPAPGARMAFMRNGRVQMDLAIVILAVMLELEDKVCTRVRIAAGAVAPVPMRLEVAERILEGSTCDSETMEQAREAAMAAVQPISDLRSSEEYRRELVGVFLRRGVQTARGA